ncbi:3-hydroxyacyl-CoA dehydrogenase NAD-binding domain-containing protein [Halomonas sp. AOP13-D3-9]
MHGIRSSAHCCNAKRSIYSDLESVVAIDTVLTSSISGIAASRFTSHLKHPERCLYERGYFKSLAGLEYSAQFSFTARKCFVRRTVCVP